MKSDKTEEAAYSTFTIRACLQPQRQGVLRMCYKMYKRYDAKRAPGCNAAAESCIFLLHTMSVVRFSLYASVSWGKLFLALVYNLFCLVAWAIPLRHYWPATATHTVQ